MHSSNGEFIRAFFAARNSGLDKSEAAAYARRTAAKVYEILTLPEVPEVPEALAVEFAADAAGSL